MKPPASPFPEDRARPADLSAAGDRPLPFATTPGEHIYSLRVRYAESDQMGVSYHANYLVWFEVGRTEWMRSRGYAYRGLEAEGVFLPVTEAACRYLVATRYDDLLYVATSIGRLGRTVVRFEYRIHKEDGRLAATGHTEHCFLSRDGRPTRAPSTIARILASGLPDDS